MQQCFRVSLFHRKSRLKIQSNYVKGFSTCLVNKIAHPVCDVWRTRQKHGTPRKEKKFKKNARKFKNRLNTPFLIFERKLKIRKIT
jgi:hypothetical protein